MPTKCVFTSTITIKMTKKERKTRKIEEKETRDTTCTTKAQQIHCVTIRQC